MRPGSIRRNFCNAIHALHPVLTPLARRFQWHNPHGRAPGAFRILEMSEEFARRSGIRLHEDAAARGEYVAEFDDAICVSTCGGVVLTRGNGIAEELTEFPWGWWFHPAMTRPWMPRVRAFERDVVFLITPEAGGNFYHWMIDCLPRLALLERHGFDLSKMIIVTTPLSHPYESESLRTIGIEAQNVMPLRDHTALRVPRAIVPALVHDVAHFAPWKREFLQRHFIDSRALRPDCRKLFVGRGDATTRRLRNEAELFAFLKNHGFTEAKTSGLTLREQAALFSSAEVIVAVHGAALTNLVFCREGTLVCEIQSEASPQEFYARISETCALRYHRIAAQPVRQVAKPHHANKVDLVLSPEGLKNIAALLESNP